MTSPTTHHKPAPAVRIGDPIAANDPEFSRFDSFFRVTAVRPQEDDDTIVFVLDCPAYELRNDCEAFVTVACGDVVEVLGEAVADRVAA